MLPGERAAQRPPTSVATGTGHMRVHCPWSGAAAAGAPPAPSEPFPLRLYPLSPPPPPPEVPSSPPAPPPPPSGATGCPCTATVASSQRGRHGTRPPAPILLLRAGAAVPTTPAAGAHINFSGCRPAHRPHRRYLQIQGRGERPPSGTTAAPCRPPDSRRMAALEATTTAGVRWDRVGPDGRVGAASIAAGGASPPRVPYHQRQSPVLTAAGTATGTTLGPTSIASGTGASIRFGCHASLSLARQPHRSGLPPVWRHAPPRHPPPSRLWQPVRFERWPCGQ